MDKIKILMVLGDTGMGGAQIFVLNLLKYIDRDRFQIDWAVNFWGEEGGISQLVKDMGCNIYCWPYFKVYNYFKFTKAWRDLLANHHYDIVHAHSTNSAAIYLKIAKEMGCITIAHSHSAGYRGNWSQRLAKTLFAKGAAKVADYWLACSHEAAVRLYGNSYKDYPRYYDIPNAIGAEAYKYNSETAAKIRKEIGVSEGSLLCGHVGSFSHPKNHAFLLDIFYEVLRSRPDARLLCCGEGVLMPQVKKKAEDLGILDKIIFTGVVMNVGDYMMAMDVFIFPSFFEGFPISVIEAEATGLPVVMSDVITKEVDVTDLISRHTLNEPASVWAETACKAANIERNSDRATYNQVISDSKYNMATSAKIISSLYEQMVESKR